MFLAKDIYRLARGKLMRDHSIACHYYIVWSGNITTAYIELTELCSTHNNHTHHPLFLRKSFFCATNDYGKTHCVHAIIQEVFQENVQVLAKQLSWADHHET